MSFLQKLKTTYEQTYQRKRLKTTNKSNQIKSNQIKTGINSTRKDFLMTILQEKPLCAKILYSIVFDVLFH